MNDHNPIRWDKKNKALLASFDSMIKNAPDIKRIGLSPQTFNMLHSTLDKKSQAFYKDEIPYRGITIYKIDINKLQEINNG